MERVGGLGVGVRARDTREIYRRDTARKSKQRASPHRWILYLTHSLNMGVLGVVTTLLVIASVTMGAAANPFGLHNFYTKPLHQVDLCIISCDACYKDDSLLQCANQCIKEEGRMTAEWAATCRLFSPTRM
ncbi:uncharacterized protein LOC122249151 [Penaeus japonicus]|uniref:uncharacterized protein LOC122249151 n=1 Tax=Penaeus japonicus TaxID=27405 RepID=UPI001C716015|nr:uncharacterized protein LOC122249151 [Penaeus japonicus]